MTQVVQSANIPDGAGETTIDLQNIPGGSDRTIKVFLYNKDDILLAEGSETIDLEKSTTKRVPIIVRPLTEISLTNGPYSPENKTLVIDSALSAHVLAYSIPLPARGSYRITIPGMAFPVVPSVFQADGKKIPTASNDPGIYTFSTDLEGIYYILCTIPQYYTGDASLRVDPDIRLKITAYDTKKNEMNLVWNVNTTVEERYMITVGEEAPIQISAGSASCLVPMPAKDTLFTLSITNKYGTASATLPFISVASITPDKQSLVLILKKPTRLTATVLPVNASLAPFVEWSSSDESRVTVDKDGIATGLDSSYIDPVTITARCGNRSGVVTITTGETGFAGGSGTRDDPYLVATKEQLNLVRYELNASYKQTAAIDLKSIQSWKPIGNESDPFTGTFDGNGYVISNMKIITDKSAHIGFFGDTNKAVLQRIGLQAVTITLESDVSGVAALGSLAGCVSATSIYRCFSTGTINGGNRVNNVGGLVGMSILNTDDNENSASINESFSTAGVTGADSVGGFIGTVSDTGLVISSSYATGKVTGINTVGGFGGKIMKADFCYSTGFVSGSNGVGGFSGSGGRQETNCFWDRTSSGQDKSATGTGKTTAEMSSFLIYSAWDLSITAGSASDWMMTENSSYPYLRWQGSSNIPVPIRARYLLEGSGLSDSVAAHNGMIAGNPDFSGKGVYSGNSMKGFTSDPNGGYGLLPNDALDITGDYSVSVWIKMVSAPAPGVKYMILDQMQDAVPGASGASDETGASSVAFGFFLLDGKPSFWTGDSSSSRGFFGVESKNAVTDGSWHHLVAVCAGETLKLYVDGLWTADGLIDSANRVTDPIKQQIAIGVLKSSYSNAVLPFIGGEIDKISFFNQALTPEYVSWVRRYDSQN